MQSSLPTDTSSPAKEQSLSVLVDQGVSSVAKAKREQDWHEVSILGARASIYFVFATPILALVANLAGLFLLHSQQPVVEGLGNIFWVCAGAFAAILTVSATLAQKNSHDHDDHS